MKANKFLFSMTIIAAHAAAHAGNIFEREPVPQPQEIARQMDERCQRLDTPSSDFVCRHWRGLLLASPKAKTLTGVELNAALLLLVLEQQQRIVKSMGLNK